MDFDVGDQMGPDLLSDLPLSIIETILMLLPIRDAIKTSVLSTKWRYRWASIPHLFFTDECIDSPDNTKHKELLKKFITFALLLHNGPITTFKICSSILNACEEVDQWILFLSRNNVRELVLDLDGHSRWAVPSCLFSCKRLTNLKLRGCYEDFPPNCNGFLCLTTLYLDPVSIDCQDLGNLISSCPLLENLTLLDCQLDSESFLGIRAPNLKYINLEGALYCLCIENSPLLKVMSITLDVDVQEDFDYSDVCTFSDVLGSVRYLERLVGQVYFTQHLTIGLDLWKPHVTFGCLKVIELDLGFENMKEAMVVLKLITNSPLLQELYICGSPVYADAILLPDAEAELMEIEYPSHTFQLLKIVKMTYLCGMPLEMELIKYLLENSPTLEKMSIKRYYIDRNDTRFNMPLKLASFHRASSLVEVLFM